MEDFEDVYGAADKLHPAMRRARYEALIAGTLFLVAPFLAANSFWHPDAFLLILSPCSFGFIWWGMQSPGRAVRMTYCQLVDVWPEMEVAIGESAFTVTTPANRDEFTWPAFSQRVEGNATVGLVSAHGIHLFPRRAFTEEQWDEFQKLVRENAPPARE